MADLTYAGWVANAAGQVVGWVNTAGDVYDASGAYVGHTNITGKAFLGLGDEQPLGYVNPGRDLNRYHYNDASYVEMGISAHDYLTRRGWRAKTIGYIDCATGRVTDALGRMVGSVDPSKNYVRREDAMGVAALILLLRYS